MAEMSETRVLTPEEIGQKAGAIPDEVPVLPTRGAVIYPYLVVPLFVGRPRSVEALEAATREGQRIALVAQRNVDVDDPGPDDIYTIGTLGEVVTLLRLPDSTIRVMIQGFDRVRIKGFVHSDPYLRAHIETAPEIEEPGIETEALVRNVVAQFERLINLGKSLPAEALETARRMSDPGRLADLIAYYTQIPVEVKQQILEAANQRERLEILANVLNREIEILEVERKISSRVKKELEDSQKEFYLREKMKAIQQELGERDERTGEIEELRSRIAAAKMPNEVEERALKEVERLERMPPASPEVVVVRTYLDWLIAMPWSVRSEEKLDIIAAERILHEDHYGLKKIKERVLEFLAVRKLAKAVKGPILCFLGPPGVGKTSMGRSIARATGRKFVRISLGGVRDEGEIRGHRRTYVGALPGRIVQGLKTAGTRNPVFMMDEVDKIGIDFRGDPASALLEVLDPEQNNAFSDHYLEVPLDLSEVMFITTGNLMDPIPPALRDRMEIIEFPGYIEEEKLKIAQLFLVPKQLKNHGLEPKQLVFTEAGLRSVDSRVHARGGSAQPGAGDRLHLPQGGKGGGPGEGQVGSRHHQVNPRLPRAAAFPVRGGGEGRRGGSGHWAGGDGVRGRYPVHRGEPDEGPRWPVADRPPRGRDAGVGKGRLQLCSLAGGRARDQRGLLPQHRCPHPRARGPDPQGRALRRHHHGDGLDLGPHPPAGAPQCGDDRGDQPAGQGAAGGRDQGEGAGGAPGGAEDGDPAERQSAGPGGDPVARPARPQVPLRRIHGRGAVPRPP